MDYVDLGAVHTASASARLSGAQMVEEFLEGLLSSSRSLYVAAVRGRQDSGARSRISFRMVGYRSAEHKHNSYAYELRRLEDESEVQLLVGERAWHRLDWVAADGAECVGSFPLLH